MVAWVKHMLGGVLLLVLSLSAWADADQSIRAALKRIAPTMPIESIKATPMAGLYAVSSEGSTLYVTQDGQFVLSGELLHIKGKQVISLTEQDNAARRVGLLKGIDPSDAVVFKAKGKTKAVVTVFTDVDCGYCRKLHAEVPEMNRLGIEVRYMAYPRDLPRSGPNAGTGAKMAEIWCNADRNAAMTAAKQGRPIPNGKTNCKAPIKEDFELGRQLGVRGTPAIYAENGEQLGGYVTAKAMAQRLGIQ